MGQVSGGKAPTRPNLFSCDKSFPENFHEKVKVDHDRYYLLDNLSDLIILDDLNTSQNSGTD